MTVGDEDAPVGPGSLVFVAAAVPHRFHDIAERLVLLVAFGPAEGSRVARRGLRPRPPDDLGQRPQSSASSGPAPDLVVAEEDVGVIAGGEERLQPRRPGRRARRACSRGVAAGDRGTTPSDGGSVAPGRRAIGRADRRPGGRRGGRPSRRPPRTDPRTRASAAGRAARPRATPARRSSSRLVVSGTRKRTVPSRSPKARYGSVSQGMPGSGILAIARHEPPRCALTLNRNDGGVAASQAATLAAVGCW